MSKENISYKLSVLWLSFTMMDSDLHKTAFENILENLVKLGNKVSLMAIRTRLPYKNKYGNKKPSIRITVIPIRYFPLISIAIFTVLQSILLPFYLLAKKIKFVIYDPDMHILSSFVVLGLCKFTKTKLVLDVRSTPVETHGVRGYLKKFWFSCSILIAKRLFDGITIITPLMKHEICNDYGLDPDKIGVWTSGVSESLFDPLAFKGDALRRKLGLKNRFIILYHGVFTPTRALIETIQSLKLLIPKYPDILLFLLGSGPSLGSLELAVQNEHLEKHVIISKPVAPSKVPEFISMCDVGIIPLPNHPYWRFQSPLKLFEYLAMEKVVVLTDIPAHRTVIGTANCGIYVSSVHPKDLAEGIEKAYLNKEVLKISGQIGRNLVKQKYTWAKVSEDLERYLCTL
ncbi:MAG: glycosyltransferase family 4 protein [Candidatus Bathyarchaeota archaeon]|nr:glycosyltransferase family 4 protein [Candidatus Bathyarchaeota archaeon]